MDKKTLGILIVGGGAIALIGLSSLSSKKNISAGGGGVGTFLQPSQPTIIVSEPQPSITSYPVTYNIPAFPEPPSVTFPESNIISAETFFANGNGGNDTPTQLTETKKTKIYAPFDPTGFYQPGGIGRGFMENIGKKDVIPETPLAKIDKPATKKDDKKDGFVSDTVKSIFDPFGFFQPGGIWGSFRSDIVSVRGT